jgi:hypothetical protein
VGVLSGVATTQVRMYNPGRAVRLEYRRAFDLARDDAGWKRWGNDAQCCNRVDDEFSNQRDKKREWKMKAN